MKYFVVEGTIKNENLMNNDILKEHMAYTQKAIDKGLILISCLKSNNTGGLFIIKSESNERLDEYLSNEPLKVYGIQDYKVIEFSPHYFNSSINEWFSK